MVPEAADVGHAMPLVLSLSPMISREIAADLEIGHVYQAQCVEAWRSSGFRVISVNAASESARIAAFYPDVEIAVARRDMTEIWGKPLLPLAEMVAALRRTGARFGGIVNSDVFVPPCELASWLIDQDTYACLLMNRREVVHPATGEGPPYNIGFDAFFFRLDALDGIDLDPFTIGVPWWDLFLPMAFLLNGFKVAQIEGVPLRHLQHAQKWNVASWISMFDVFRDRLRDDFERLAAERGDTLPSLVGLMHEDRMCRYFADHPVKRRVDDPGFDMLWRYRSAYAHSVADLILQLSDGVRFIPPGAARVVA